MIKPANNVNSIINGSVNLMEEGKLWHETKRSCNILNHLNTERSPSFGMFITQITKIHENPLRQPDHVSRQKKYPLHD